MRRHHPLGMLLLLAALLAAGCGSNGGNNAADSTFALAPDAVEIARQWVQRADVPGAVLAVGTPQGGIWTAAIGVAEHRAPTKELDVNYGDAATNALDGAIPWEGRPMTPDLYMRIGSRTKTYTAALILKLREQGLVDLDKTVNDYLPAGLVPNGDKVTLRRLLDMTSGIEDYLAAFSPFDVADPSTSEDILRFVRGLPNGGIRLQPGQDVYYSNTNYIILGRIAEQVTGKTYRQLVHDIIIQPLGLAATLVPDPERSELPTPNAHGYKIDLPWDVWSDLWRSETATQDEVLAYLGQNPELVDAFAAQDTAVLSKYPQWVIFYLQQNPVVAIIAYARLHPDLLDALRAYKDGDTNALAPYPAPLIGALVNTPGLIDFLLSTRTRKPGVVWHDVTEIYTSSVGPVGAVVSTAADQVRWIRALELGSFLSPESQALRGSAWQPYPLVSNATTETSYGFASYRKVRRATGNVFVGHGGRLEGYDSYGYLWEGHGWIVVVLVNALNLNLHELDAGYPGGSIAGTIGDAIFDRIIASENRGR